MTLTGNEVRGDRRWPQEEPAGCGRVPGLAHWAVVHPVYLLMSGGTPRLAGEGPSRSTLSWGSYRWPQMQAGAKRGHHALPKELGATGSTPGCSLSSSFTAPCLSLNVREGRGWGSCCVPGQWPGCVCVCLSERLPGPGALQALLPKAGVPSSSHPCPMAVLLAPCGVQPLAPLCPGQRVPGKAGRDVVVMGVQRGPLRGQVQPPESPTAPSPL